MLEFTQEKGNQLNYDNWDISADLKMISLVMDELQGWRHSFFGNYMLFDVETKQLLPMAKSKSDKHIPGQLGSGMVSFTLWSPVGHKIAWVRDNDLYVTEKNDQIRVTFDGSEEIINGISDWVYEEEILAAKQACWFSPDSKFIAYAKFNDTLVKSYRLQYYDKFGRLQYPREVDIKYPKPGTPNPSVGIFVADLRKNESKAPNLQVVFTDQPFSESDTIITQVNWYANTGFLLRLMNRVQDHQKLYVVSLDNATNTWKAILVRDEKTPDGAWYQQLQPLTLIPTKANTSELSYIEIDDIKSGFAHLAYYKDVHDKSPSFWLTSGNWEVVSVLRVDAERKLV